MPEGNAFKTATVDGGNTSATILAGETQFANFFDCGTVNPVGFYVDDAWTAANVTFIVGKQSAQGQISGVQKDINGVLLTIPVEPGDRIPLEPSIFGPIRYINIVSSLAQVANTVIQFDLAPVYATPP